MPEQAILFDLDGTLLPMDNDAFTQGYFGLLAQAVAPLGYRAGTLIPALWEGVKAMVQNDGTKTNQEAFWQVFATVLGSHVYGHRPAFDRFYAGEFRQAIAFTQPNPLARNAVAAARARAERVVLATNPLFPAVGVQTRLRWVGLELEDFDLVTHYGNSRFCKPNPAYYQEILRELDLDPARCLMVGNDAHEDMEAAQAAGLATFLVTDCLICRGPLPKGPSGSFQALLEHLESESDLL